MSSNGYTCGIAVAFALLAAIASSPLLQAQTERPQNPLLVTANTMENEVRRIFERSCAECHDEGQRRKPKGDFGYVMDFPRMIEEAYYVLPGEPDLSDIYTLLIESDPDMRMPPPDSDAPKLSPKEIETVRSWIVSLNHEPSATPGPETAVLVQPAEAPSPPLESLDFPHPPDSLEGKPFSAARTFARTHPMLVHFPVALIIMAAGVEVLGWVRGTRKAWLPAVRWAIAIATLTAPLTVAAGWLLADVEGYKDSTVFIHRWLGVGTAVVSALSWILLELGEKLASTKLSWYARIVLITGALLVSITGHTGAELIYGEGYPFN